MLSATFLRSSLLATAAALILPACRTASTPAPVAPAAAAPAPSAASEPAAAPATETAAPLHALGYAGSQAALAALDAEIVAAGRDAGKLSALTSRLVGILSQADASFAARQAAAQRLAPLLAGPISADAAAAARGALVAMLDNDLQVDLARLALEPVPGEAIDRIFLAALERSTGRKRLAVIQSIGTRRIVAAIPRLAELQRDQDRRLAAAATRALGEIGGAAALAAIRSAPETEPTERSLALLAAAMRASAEEATTVYNSLAGDRALPPHVRAAAIRAWLGAHSREAAKRITDILGGNDWDLKEAVLEGTPALPAAEIVPALASAFPNFDPRTQVAVLAAFERLAHAAAVPTVTAAVSHADPDVRVAAVTTLGTLPGDATIVRLLAEQISADAPTARVARQSLARLNGPDVSATILAGAQEGLSTLRVVFIEQLSLRYMPEALPQLVALRADPASDVRIAAVNAIGELGGAPEQRTLLDWTVAATDAAEQARALRAFVTLTLRLPNADTRAEPLFAAIEQGSPEVALRLIPALPRVGGASAAACAARLAIRENAAVAEAASATLARWPDRKALRPLLDVAEKAARPAQRASAQATALQWLERNRDAWSSELTSSVSRLLTSAADDETRRRLLIVLRRANDDDALALVEKLSPQPGLAAEAKETALTIRANLGPAPAFRASGNNGNMRNLTDNRPATFWSVSANAEQWLEIDFRNSRPLHQITLDHGERTENFPERYEVFVTDDLATPGAARVSGSGQEGKTVIAFPPGTKGRYVVIKHVGERRDGTWSVAELFVE